MDTFQYFSKDDLLKGVIEVDVNVDDLISSDSYNESKLLEKFNTYNDKDKILLIKSAVQLSIIGYGKQNYGAIKHDNEIYELIDIFKKLGIKHNNGINSEYKDDEFSVRRLLRFFRFQIQKFIIKNKRPSYLFIKYSEKDMKYMDWCFPGSEHMIETKDQAHYLINTYKNLDQLSDTKFVDRLKRVFIARGILSPLEF